MHSNVRSVVLCCAVVSLWCILPSTASTVATNSTAQPVTGYGFEVMMAKLDFLQYKLLTMEFGQKERDEEFAEKLVNVEKLFTACANHEQMRKEISQLVPKEDFSKAPQLLLAMEGFQRKRPFQSCKEAPANESGVVSIQLSDKEEPFEAYCEQNSFGGGWLVIQYRFDGSQDFYRNWTEYRDGFGNVNQEFWIGLERLHQLTSRRPHELMVEMKDFTGIYKYANYKNFEVGSETEQYSLKTLGVYQGTSGDSLTQHHKGMKFSTKDRDNDTHSVANCAKLREGGWWYYDCTDSNLNGRYLNNNDPKAMFWNAFKSNRQGLAYSRMMIREM